METRYFHILTFSYIFRRIFLWIKGLQSICRVTWACSFRPALLNLIWLSFGKIEKSNFSSNPCFLNLLCWERYNQPHIKHCFKQFVLILTGWCMHHRFAKVQLTKWKHNAQLTVMARNKQKKLADCQMWFLKRWGFSYAIHLWKIKIKKIIFP